MAASGRGVLASTSYLTGRLAAASTSAASTSSAFRLRRTKVPPLLCSNPQCQSHSLHSSSSRQQEPSNDSLDNVVGSDAPAKGIKKGKKSASRSSATRDDSWINIFDTGVLDELRGGASTSEPVTLEEFRSLRPSADSIRVATHFAPHLRQRLKAERLWELAYKSVNSSYNVHQLVQIAQMAKVPLKRKGKTNHRKSDVVTLLIKHDFKIPDPREKPPSPEAFFVKLIPMSRTALFLLLVDSGRNLAKLSSSHDGVDLRPELKMEGEEQPEPVFYLAASGRDQSLIEKGLTAAVQEFVSTIRSELYTLDMPAEALDSDVIQHISQQSRCAINLEPSPPPSSPSSPVPRPRLRIAATSWEDIGKAQELLSAMQGRYFQPTSSLMSYAAPSPLDPMYEELAGEDLTVYGFLPTIPHSSVLWSLRSTLGDRSPSSYFRLARVRRAAWSQTSTDKVGRMSLADLENSAEALDSPRNWKTLDDKLDLSSTKALDKLASSPATTQHSLHIGQLLYPGRSSLEDIAGPENQVLQQVFGAPLSGSWTLDTAYEWFSQQRGQTGHSPRPLWTPTQLDGSAVDAVSEHGPKLKMWFNRKPAVEEEKIRLVYWAFPASTSSTPTGDEAVRLEIDVREVEEVKPSPDLAEQGSHEDAYKDLFGGASSDGDGIVRKYAYVVDSARWSTVKQADVFAPDHSIDLRARASKTREVDPAGLQALAPLQEYLTGLSERVAAALSPSPSSPPAKPKSSEKPLGTERWTMDDEDEEPEPLRQQPEHPKTLRRPVPLDSSPPLTLTLNGMSCRFESAERVFSSRWELDMMFGEDLYQELYGKDGKREADDDITGTDTGTGRARARTPSRTYFINETTVGGESGDAGRTCSRIEWPSEDDEGDKVRGEKDDGSLWEKRIHSVRGLFKKLVIGQMP